MLALNRHCHRYRSHKYCTFGILLQNSKSRPNRCATEYQEAQLSQTGRTMLCVIEYFALKVIGNGTIRLLYTRCLKKRTPYD